MREWRTMTITEIRREIDYLGNKVDSLRDELHLVGEKLFVLSCQLVDLEDEE